jgi:hypothetical protein
MILRVNRDYFSKLYNVSGRSCLGRYAKNKMVAGLSPNVVTEIFNTFNPSSRNMALGLVQPEPK